MTSKIKILIIFSFVVGSGMFLVPPGIVKADAPPTAQLYFNGSPSDPATLPAGQHSGTFTWTATNSSVCSLYRNNILIAERWDPNADSGTATLGDINSGEVFLLQCHGKPIETAPVARSQIIVYIPVQKKGTIKIRLNDQTISWTLTGPNSYSSSGTGNTDLQNMLYGIYTLIPGFKNGYNAVVSPSSVLELKD